MGCILPIVIFTRKMRNKMKQNKIIFLLTSSSRSFDSIDRTCLSTSFFVRNIFFLFYCSQLKFSRVSHLFRRFCFTLSTRLIEYSSELDDCFLLNLLYLFCYLRENLNLTILTQIQVTYKHLSFSVVEKAMAA